MPDSQSAGRSGGVRGSAGRSGGLRESVSLSSWRRTDSVTAEVEPVGC